MPAYASFSAAPSSKVVETHSHGDLCRFCRNPSERIIIACEPLATARIRAAHIREWLISPYWKNSRRPARLDNAPRRAIRDSRLRRHANGSAWVKDHIPSNGSFTARVFVIACNASPRKLTGRYHFRGLFVAPSPRPLTEIHDPSISNLRSCCAPAQYNKGASRAIRDPPARMALLLGRCRFVTASISPVWFSKIRFGACVQET